MSHLPHIAFVALAVACYVGAPVAHAQPDGGPGSRPVAREADRSAPPRGPMAREAIEQRLKERRDEVARLEGMLRRLDQGQAPQHADAEGAPPRAHEQPEPGPVGGPSRQVVRERVLAFLREHNPDFARHLDELRQARPDLADRALADFAPRLRELSELKENDPPLFAMRLEGNMLDWHMRRIVFESVRTARAGDGGNIDEPGAAPKPVDLPALRERLAPLVEQRFRLSLRERAHSIGALEQRVATLRDEIATEEAAAPRIIEDRLNRLMEHVERMSGANERFDGRRPRPGRPGQPGPAGRPREHQPDPSGDPPPTKSPNDP